MVAVGLNTVCEERHQWVDDHEHGGDASHCRLDDVEATRDFGELAEAETENALMIGAGSLESRSNRITETILRTENHHASRLATGRVERHQVSARYARGEVECERAFAFVGIAFK